MSLIPLECPSCGANLKVNSEKDAAICEYCGKPYIVKDAIVNNYINIDLNHATIHADTVNLTIQNEFDIVSGKLVKYIGEKQNVVIPNNVLEIGDSVFEDLNITAVAIPKSVNKIGNKSFYNCKQLKSVMISDNVTMIGDKAFAYSGLETIDIPSSVLKIGVGAFEHCLNLVNANISGKTFVCNYAFRETPFWAGKCQKCGHNLNDSKLYDKLRGYSKKCQYCGSTYR